jgi:hypothetical protein
MDRHEAGLRLQAAREAIGSGERKGGSEKKAPGRGISVLRYAKVKEGLTIEVPPRVGGVRTRALRESRYCHSTTR